MRACDLSFTGGEDAAQSVVSHAAQLQRSSMAAATTASASILIHDEVLPFRASALDGFPTLAAVDRGQSLTKMVFLPKDAQPEGEFLPLRCISVPNADFEAGLRFLKATAQLPACGVIHVTGVGGALYTDRIEAVLGLRPVFVHEFTTIAAGPYLMTRHCPADRIFHPAPAVKEWKVESEMLSKLFEGAVHGAPAASGGQGEEELFPAVVYYIGSGSVVLLVQPDGSFRMLGGATCSGKPFLGLAQIVLGTNDYDEIMRLAEAGDRSHVDMQVKDVIRDDPNTPFGRFPPEMPIIPFGKASDSGWAQKKGQATREDMAQALVNFFVSDIMTTLFNVIGAAGVTKFYIAGNLTRAEITRKLFYERLFAFAPISGLNLDVRFIGSGHTGAIACMLNKTEAPK